MCGWLVTNHLVKAHKHRCTVLDFLGRLGRRSDRRGGKLHQIDREEPASIVLAERDLIPLMVRRHFVARQVELLRWLDRIFKKHFIGGVRHWTDWNFNLAANHALAHRPQIDDIAGKIGIDIP